MKTTVLTLILSLTFYLYSQSQTQARQNTKDLEQFNSIFDRIELQEVDTKQNILYGYCFFDKDKSKLEKLKVDLAGESYRFVELAKKTTANISSM